MKKWLFKYKEHDIEVTNRIRGEELRVDGELQDAQTGIGVRSRLYGRIKSGQGEGERIKVSIGDWFVVNCIVFIDDREVFRS